MFVLCASWSHDYTVYGSVSAFHFTSKQTMKEKAQLTVYLQLGLHWSFIFVMLFIIQM